MTAPATATFTVVANGAPAPSYQWQQSTDSGGTWNAIGGATSNSYTTPATNFSNSGTEYECVITNSQGTVTSNAATLTVNTLPSISAQPSSQTVTAPATATFTLTAGGSPAPSYQWQKSTNGGGSWTAIGGATANSYTTPATTGVDNGTQFECVVTNIAGSVTSNAVTLTVDAVPAITTQPSNQTVTAPATATFTVIANGTPTPSYQWQQSTDSGSSWTAIAGATSNSYTTPATTLSNSGTEYECVVSNTAGSVTSNPATLTVNTLPSISAQPSSQTVTAPATATFTVTASGSPAPSYQWQQSTNGGGSWTAIGGATLSSYTTPATSLANNGTEFDCVVANSAGSVTSSAAMLTVDSVPSAPTTVTAVGGDSQATVSFSGALSNGSPISIYTVTSNPDGIMATGASSPIIVPGLTNGTIYTFTVTATNGIGTGAASAPSNSVTPSPVAAPTSLKGTILGSRIGGHVIYGGTSLTWVQSTDSGIVQNKIYRSAGGGLNTLLATVDPKTSYIDTSVTQGIIYNYTVTATNTSGSESSLSNSVSLTY